MVSRTFVLLVAFLLTCCSHRLSAQLFSEYRYVYFKSAGGISAYFGDLNEVNSHLPFFGYVYRGGVGFYFTPQIAVGFDYRVADYPRTDRPVLGRYTRNHTTNLYLQYSFSTDHRVSPYLLGGLGMTFYGTYDNDPIFDPAFGPMAGLGVNVRLTDQVSLFVEGKMDFVLDDEAMDEVRGRMGFDALGFVGGGVQINLRRTFRPITDIAISGPSEITAGQSVVLEAAVIGDPTEPVEYRWDLGDGTVVIGKSAAHVYRESGTYVVHVRASNRRSSREAVHEIRVRDPAAR